jgi:dihydroneopterin aldolase
MDIVFIEALRIESVIGIYDWERASARPWCWISRWRFDNTRPAATDRIERHARLQGGQQAPDRSLSKSPNSGLVETLAERCAAIILGEFSVSWVRLKLSKPGAVRGARAVGVIIERSATHEPRPAEPGQQRQQPRVTISPWRRGRVARANVSAPWTFSPVYRTPAVGFDGPDFLNARRCR